MAFEVRACDVCRLLDFDCTPKLCFYCPMCDAWICQVDGQDTLKVWLTRRLPAAAKRALESGFRGDPNYVANESKKLTQESSL